MDLQEFNLNKAEEMAVRYYQFILDCYNSKDGTGLFTGMTRYTVLQERVILAATESQNLHDFWCNVTRIMKFYAVPKAADERLSNFWLLETNLQREIIDVFINHTAMVNVLARQLHTDNKEERKLMQQESEASE